MHQELQGKRKQEIEKIARIAEIAEKYKKDCVETMNDIEKFLSGNTQKVSLGKYNILGYRDTGTSIRVVLQENELSQPFVVWSTAAISRILEVAKPIFERTADQYHRIMFWIVEKSHTIEIEIDDQTCFQTK